MEQDLSRCHYLDESEVVHMEDMVLTGQAVDSTNGMEEMIKCERCGEDKPRTKYRRVANPKVCLECISTTKAECKKERKHQASNAQNETKDQGDKETNGEKKHRVGVYLSSLSLAILGVLALQHKNDSAAMEYMLQTVYGDMSPEEKSFVTYVQLQQQKQM